MTWKELKHLIDNEILRLGASEDVEVWFVDVTFPDEDNIVIGIDEDCGLQVS